MVLPGVIFPAWYSLFVIFISASQQNEVMPELFFFQVLQPHGLQHDDILIGGDLFIFGGDKVTF